MKKVRHHVQRIHPDASAAFDQQFWPVLMAICVVAAIGAGAVVSLLSGPVMWVSLLLLPVAALFAIICLHRLDNSFLKRSLQFAVLLSLGVHLFILMISALLTIFSVEVPAQTAKLIKKPERRIVVSNRNRQLVINQTNKQLTPDNPVETDRTQTNPETQTREVPIVEQKKPEERQISERRMKQPVVPRKDQQLSQRKRSERQNRPVSSSGQVSIRSTTKAAASASQPTPRNTEAKKAASAKSAAAKAVTQNQRESTQPKSNLQRRQSTSAPAKASRATARSRRENTSIPRIANRATVAPEKRTAKPSPTATSSKLDVQRQSVVRSTAAKSQSKIDTKPKQIEQTSARRVSSRNRNAIKSEQVSKTVDRTIAAKSPTARPSLQPARRSVASDSTSRTQPQPQSFAVTRSSRGSAGAGRSSNLERATGGDPSPVQIASDSSNRRQSNRTSDNISLSSLQQATRMDSGRSSESQRVLRADTVRWAQRSGSSQSADRNVQASAASVDSSLSRQRGNVAMEKGSSMLDVGPTKVVTETNLERRSGGGSPELSDSLTRASIPTGGRTTNNELQSDAAVEIDSAQVATSEASQVSTGDGEIADFDSRTDQQQANQTTSRGQVSFEEPGTAETGQPVAMSERRDGEDSSSSSVATDDLAATTNERAGHSRSRSTHAPSVSRRVTVGGESAAADNASQIALGDGNFGSADQVQRSDSGSSSDDFVSSGMNADRPDDSASASSGTTNLSRRSTASTGNSTSSDAVATNLDSRRSGAALSGQSNVVVNNQADGNRPNQSAGQIAITDSDSSEIGRQSSESTITEAGMKLDLEAEDGAAGLADVASRRTGIPVDASVESDQLSPQRESRFIHRESGGAPSVVPNVTLAAEAFRKRNPASLANSGPSTEAAIELGLAFLARHQLADGSWTLGQFDTENPLFQNQLTSDTAATGLALLAFQGAGYNHREYKYAAQVKAGIEWLIRNQAPDGGLFVESDAKSNASSRLYSHGIAALALTEAYGMTQDETIREATQRALDYIADTQDREKGGWRYYAMRNKRSSDTSVTGWMMMALKSGRLAGLETRKSTMDGITAWLRVAQSPSSRHEFRYNPYAVDSPGVSRAHGKEVSTSMTSVGLLMQVYSGWRPTDSRFLDGAEVLLQQLPSDRTSRVRDTYYWYYATQVLKHAGGDYWERWRSALHPLLINSQVQEGDLAGSWHPYKPVPDRWGPQGGRLYVTAMNLLSLEVKYRLLPLYEKTID